MNILYFRRKSLSESEIRKAFSNIDNDKNGKINLKELLDLCRDLFSSVTREEIEKMFREVDQNNDGYIDLEEFKNIVQTA